MDIEATQALPVSDYEDDTDDENAEKKPVSLPTLLTF